MNTVKHGPEKEFSFIQEKVVTRKKNKFRKFLLSFGITLFLAVIFGVVARITFIKSGTLLFTLFGLDEVERQQLLIPSDYPQDSESAGTSGQEPEVSGTPDTQKDSEQKPTVGQETNNDKDPETDTTGEGEKSSEEEQQEQKNTITYVEQKVDATIEDYQNMYLELKKLANQCSYSLATVTAVESGVDWFNDSYETRQTTTGIVIGENNVDMLVLTTLDKVLNADALEVTFSGNTSMEGKLWDYDEDYNLAVIAVELKSIPAQQLSMITPAEFGESYTLSIGTPIIALGNPNGYSGSMELGMITSKGSTYSVVDSKLDLFNSDITNNELSGGVIINLNGEIIGIITNTLKEDLNENISTAIGITRIKSMIESLANKKDRVLFGIKGEDIPITVLQEVGIENGIYVTEVVTDSPAFEAGIRQGDIITLMNESKVNSITSFSTLINEQLVGDTVKVTVQRMSKQVLKEMEFEVILQKKNNQ